MPNAAVGNETNRSVIIANELSRSGRNFGAKCALNQCVSVRIA